MPFLTVGGTEIPCANPRTEDDVEVGARLPSWAGGEIDLVESRKRALSAETTPLGDADYATVYAALTAPGPLTVTGDAVDDEELTCNVRVEGGTTLLGATHRRTIRFRVTEV
jgi:hypothetical protein